MHGRLAELQNPGDLHKAKLAPDPQHDNLGQLNRKLRQRLLGRSRVNQRGIRRLKPLLPMPGEGLFPLRLRDAERV